MQKKNTHLSSTVQVIGESNRRKFKKDVFKKSAQIAITAVSEAKK